jgi:hypothetical protein
MSAQAQVWRGELVPSCGCVGADARVEQRRVLCDRCGAAFCNAADDRGRLPRREESSK